MIVPVLDGRVGAPVVGARRALIVVVLGVVMLGRHLIVMLVGSVLRVERRWAYSGQRKRHDGQSKRLPKVMAHGCYLFCNDRARKQLNAITTNAPTRGGDAPRGGTRQGGYAQI
jgi:hypothetical protein